MKCLIGNKEMPKKIWRCAFHWDMTGKRIMYKFENDPKFCNYCKYQEIDKGIYLHYEKESIIINEEAKMYKIIKWLTKL